MGKYHMKVLLALKWPWCLLTWSPQKHGLIVLLCYLLPSTEGKGNILHKEREKLKERPNISKNFDLDPAKRCFSVVQICDIKEQGPIPKLVVAQKLETITS